MLEILISTCGDDNDGGWLGCCNGKDAFCKVRVKRVNSRNYDGRVFRCQCRVAWDGYRLVDPEADDVDQKSDVAEEEEESKELCIFVEGEKVVDRCDQPLVDCNVREGHKERLEAIELV